jgi:hypothetical protein
MGGLGHLPAVPQGNPRHPPSMRAQRVRFKYQVPFWRFGPARTAQKGGCSVRLPGEKTDQLRCAKRKESLRSLNGAPRFAGPPFTAKALLPLAYAPPALDGYRFGKRILLFLESSMVAQWAPANRFARPSPPPWQNRVQRTR